MSPRPEAGSSAAGARAATASALQRVARALNSTPKAVGLGVVHAAPLSHRDVTACRGESLPRRLAPSSSRTRRRRRREGRTAGRDVRSPQPRLRPPLLWKSFRVCVAFEHTGWRRLSSLGSTVAFVRAGWRRSGGGVQRGFFGPSAHIACRKLRYCTRSVASGLLHAAHGAAARGRRRCVAHVVASDTWHAGNGTSSETAPEVLHADPITSLGFERARAPLCRAGGMGDAHLDP